MVVKVITVLFEDRSRKLGERGVWRQQKDTGVK